MKHIEKEARIFKEKHLLKKGCGMGFDSLELLKRDVRVTVTDLTSSSVELAQHTCIQWLLSNSN